VIGFSGAAVVVGAIAIMIGGDIRGWSGPVMLIAGLWLYGLGFYGLGRLSDRQRGKTGEIPPRLTDRRGGGLDG
jgi:hypothetical protein